VEDAGHEADLEIVDSMTIIAVLHAARAHEGSR
jgi:hypothetical protein